MVVPQNDTAALTEATLCAIAEGALSPRFGASGTPIAGSFAVETIASLRG